MFLFKVYQLYWLVELCGCVFSFPYCLIYIKKILYHLQRCMNPDFSNARRNYRRVRTCEGFGGLSVVSCRQCDGYLN